MMPPTTEPTSTETILAPLPSSRFSSNRPSLASPWWAVGARGVTGMGRQAIGGRFQNNVGFEALARFMSAIPPMGQKSQPAGR